MRFRSFTVSFLPAFGETWFKARNPDELNEAVRQELLTDSKGKPAN
jgi:hypothetical protein